MSGEYTKEQGTNMPKRLLLSIFPSLEKNFQSWNNQRKGFSFLMKKKKNTLEFKTISVLGVITFTLR